VFTRGEFDSLSPLDCRQHTSETSNSVPAYPDMKYFPDHVEGFVQRAARFDEEADDYHHYYQVVCCCGGSHFRLFLGNKKSVKAQCVACPRMPTIYDLAYYPAATKLRGSEEFLLAANEGEKTGLVYVMYEYGERDEDEPFDSNDITWCQVWLENSQGMLLKVLDDETA
jgi:hypothetical protein